MGIGKITLVLGVVTRGKPETTGARHLVDISSLRPQTFICNGKIESGSQVQGKKSIDILALFHHGLEIQFGHGRRHGTVTDLIGFQKIKMFRLESKFGKRRKSVQTVLQGVVGLPLVRKRHQSKIIPAQIIITVQFFYGKRSIDVGGVTIQGYHSIHVYGGYFFLLFLYRIRAVVFAVKTQKLGDFFLRKNRYWQY